ncbi:hypothetical protein SADUNF_Sadunf17G0063100 [Salix dunnii]|uniref:Retrotransposon Copia-like N-terminal domain-containing protein n=1 Tax=Salix dunnii TaxID=1413687 RepID=A0A835J665_9ROSI|nr:hypothetical protein SADUNF_Sadunf17G0063100 [Salix dunnii]
MTDTRATVTEIVPAMSKITDHKLNDTNYLEWSKTIRVYLRSVEKDDHLCEEPPDDETKKKPWMRDDACLFLQIRNSIDSEIVGLLNHCEFFKELMDYLEFLYSGKGNMCRMYDVCKAFYCAKKKAKSLITYFMDFMKTYEELNVLLPFSTGIKPGHTKKFCKKLQNRNQRNQFANVITTSSTTSRSFDKTIMVSADEFAKFSQYQESLKISTPDTTPTETGNPETFSNFQSHLAPSFVTIADGSTSKIVGFGTVKPTSYITLSSVLEDSFFQSSTLNSDSEGEDENWLIYQVTISNTLTDSSGQPHDGVDVSPTPARPPIVQVYSRRQETTDTCPAPTPLLSDPPCDLDLPIGLRKGLIKGCKYRRLTLDRLA